MFANVKGRVALIAALAVGLTGVAGAASASGAPRVPWNQAGPGWELVEYSSAAAGVPAKPGPATLYLVSPAGGRYALYHWPASGMPVPAGVVWR